MSEFPKPQTIRAQQVINDIRNAAETCEICSNLAQEVHHIKSKGAGGPDIRCNLIALCFKHHHDAQMYRIPQADLFRITRGTRG